MGTICAPSTIRNILKFSALSRPTLLRPYSKMKPDGVMDGVSMRPCVASAPSGVEKNSRIHESVCTLRSSYPYGNRRRFNVIASQASANKEGEQSLSKMPHRAFVAFGSNMGNRLEWIEKACQALEQEEDIILKRTSSIWETKAMYYTDQNRFLNGVCEIRTHLAPLQLLDRLQAIENSLNRKRTIAKGPRTIDLDILLYDDAVIEHERLSVPHKLMLERGFVLQPLCELIPDETHPSAPGDVPYFEHLNNLAMSEPPASTSTPLSLTMEPLATLLSSRTTRVMSILNVTPDSFSDGGVHSSLEPESLATSIRQQILDGATIIDVGGESTRPNAVPVGHEEEKRRVLPAIAIIKQVMSEMHVQDTVAISIDTYRSTVAQAAIEAGADIVNDVSAGLLDSDMLRTVAQLKCPVILMHMRGNPSNMSNANLTSYPEGLIDTIGKELLARVQAAQEAGIRRWRIILDPGIGFAKTAAQNLELLRRFGELRDYPGLEGLPWLVGSSRKGFIGKITGVQEARDRTWGTAATVAAAVQGGADIVRVHDVKEMSQVVKMSDAIWRV